MTILVTGGAGYIGSHTCVELLNAGQDIVVLDNFHNSKKEVLNRVGELTGKQFAFYECDLLDRAGLNEIFANHQIDAVIHFAGLKAVAESTVIPLEYYKNNVSGTVVLLQAMEAAGVRKIVFSSSATVYGQRNIPPYREDMITGETASPYGRTKYMIEEILKDLHKADERWGIDLLRYFNPIGAHESGRIGEDPSDIPNNLMPYIAQVAIGKLDMLPVYGKDYPTPDGTCGRDYIHVVDLAVGHVKAVERLEQKTGVHIYNLGTGTRVSVFELMGAFTRATGIDIPYRIEPRRPGDIAFFYADASKAKEELGWTAKRDIDDMCRDTWRWQKNNPMGYGEK